MPTTAVEVPQPATASANAVATIVGPRLPADRSLLAGVDILGRPRSKKECLHVFRQEASRLRIHDVEAVVVDQHRLLTHPLCPAFLADLADDPGAHRSRKGSALESSACFTTTHTLHRLSHSRGNSDAGKGCYERA